MKRNRILAAVIILAALAVVILGVLSTGSNRDSASDLEIDTVRQGTLSSGIEANGIVQSNQSALLVWKISGQIENVTVQPGDRVSAGDMLASLSETSLPPFIITAQAELINAQNQLENLMISKIQRAQAQKALDEAQNALDDALSPQALQAEALLAVAEAEKAVEKAQRSYDIIAALTPQSAIDQAYANLLLAENKVKETEDLLERLENFVFVSGPTAELVPDWVINNVKHEIRRAIKRLELQLTQERLALENSRSRYNALLEPPDPVKVAAAEAELATAKAQLEAAEREWERIKDGFSPAEIAVLEAKLMDAQREWLRVKDGPDPDDITLMEAQIAAAQAAIQQMTITAPFAGTLTNVRSQVNDLVATGTPAFQLDDLSTLHIDLAVSEIDINRVILGQEAVISLDSAPAKEYQGVVSEIGLVGTENFGVTNYRVRVEVAESDPDIKPGMSASVRIVVDEKENVLLVPSRAIHSLNGETVVYRWDNASEGRIAAQDNQIEEPGSDGEFRLPRIGIRPIQNQIHPVMVELGATSGADTEVVAGELNAGDVIVLNPPAE